jgi:hypothetical protein
MWFVARVAYCIYIMCRHCCGMVSPFGSLAEIDEFVFDKHFDRLIQEDSLTRIR